MKHQNKTYFPACFDLQMTCYFVCLSVCHLDLSQICIFVIFAWRQEKVNFSRRATIFTPECPHFRGIYYASCCCLQLDFQIGWFFWHSFDMKQTNDLTWFIKKNPFNCTGPHYFLNNQIYFYFFLAHLIFSHHWLISLGSTDWSVKTWAFYKHTNRELVWFYEEDLGF